jgi:NACHT domain
MFVNTSNFTSPAAGIPSRYDNPFATCWTRPGAIPFLFSEGNSADGLIDKLRVHDWWGEILGPHGSGKSTLLEAIKPKLLAAGKHVHQILLRVGQRRVPYEDLPQSWLNDLTKSATKRESRHLAQHALLLIIDGYEQLGWLARWQLKKRCRCAGIGLLVTSHRPTGLPTLIHLTPDGRLIEQLVAQLCAKVPSRVSLADIAASHACHGSNVREVFFDLYDRHERQRRAL